MTGDPKKDQKSGQIEGCYFSGMFTSLRRQYPSGQRTSQCGCIGEESSKGESANTKALRQKCAHYIQGELRRWVAEGGCAREGVIGDEIQI